MKREEREVLILARRAGSPRGENVAAECEDADRLDRGPRTRTDTQHTHLHWHYISQRVHAVENLPEDKSFPHFKGNDRGKAFRFLHAEEALCRRISSDPVQSLLSKNSNSLFLVNSCVHLKSTR